MIGRWVGVGAVVVEGGLLHGMLCPPKNKKPSLPVTCSVSPSCAQIAAAAGLHHEELQKDSDEGATAACNAVLASLEQAIADVASRAAAADVPEPLSTCNAPAPPEGNEEGPPQGAEVAPGGMDATMQDGGSLGPTGQTGPTGPSCPGDDGIVQ